jgi:hypothetical protein
MKQDDLIFAETGNGCPSFREKSVNDRHQFGLGFVDVETRQPVFLPPCSSDCAECETRSAAVIEARKLLAKHIDDLGESTRIEAYVVSELADEMREREASEAE